ncbi:MAG TPA: Na(+)/H(+) antiporter subunit D [Gammaproteobacteria bacterium]|nr:Na(+)/H(+) antiporter subunit D [Gammaproteobacteria bacterium]
MTELLLHPGAVMLIAALLIPMAPAALRAILLVGAPAIALALVWQLPDTLATAPSFLGMTLEPIRADALSRLFGTVFALMGIAGGLYALRQTNRTELSAAYAYMAFAFGVIFAGDLITVLIFWELMALGSATVIFASGTEAARRAGLRYLAVHLFGGVLLMAGVAGEVASSGQVTFASMLPDSVPRALILAGFLINTGAPPFSSWVPDSYPEASTTGMVFLSAFTTKTAVYVLARGFPGAEILIVLGLIMIFYGIFYGLAESQPRRMLGYSIVNQVGFMLVGIGIGTELAVSGAVAHAFAHIIYKALLIMAVGSVLSATGRQTFSELGGIGRQMPFTALCCIIGGLAISAFPFTSGFVAKALVSEAAYQEGLDWLWLLLALGTAGVFLDVGIKLQYFVFFGPDRGLRPAEAPLHERGAMGFFALLCIGIGLMPGTFYALLPVTPEYSPYTTDHVLLQFELLFFAGLAFFVWLRFAGWPLGRNLTLDVDWLWRRPLRDGPLRTLEGLAGARERIADQLLLTKDRIIVWAQRVDGPVRAIAGSHPTGRMVFFTIAILAAILIQELFFT